MKEYGVMILRVTLGVIYVMHAYLGLFVFGPTAMATLMQSIGLADPTLMAMMVIAAHAAGGAMLILGVWARLAAAANTVVILGALLAIHLRQGFFLKGVILDAAAGQTQVVGFEYSLLLVAASLALALIGPGAWALTGRK